MANTTDITQLFDWLDKPAFLAENGVVCRVNRAAELRGIAPGVQVTDLLRSGQTEYSELTQGSLYLTLQVEEQVTDACVHCMEGTHVFVLEQTDVMPQLRTLAQVSSHFRHPLNNVISAAERLCGLLPADCQELSELTGTLNQSIHQLHRLVGNMSDAYLYSSKGFAQMQLQELGSFLGEVFDKAAALCATAGASVEFTAPEEKIFCLFDSEMLERAVLNLLSNAMKYSSENTRIRAVLKRIGSRVQLSITDSGCGIAPEVRASVFARYMRAPELEDRLQGPGLGLSLVCAAVRSHDGTVLLEQPEEGGTKVTLSFPIRQTSGIVRTPVFTVDYAGERDHALLELSEVLPSKLYEN